MPCIYMLFAFRLKDRDQYHIIYVQYIEIRLDFQSSCINIMFVFIIQPSLESAIKNNLSILKLFNKELFIISHVTLKPKLETTTTVSVLSIITFYNICKVIHLRLMYLWFNIKKDHYSLITNSYQCRLVIHIHKLYHLRVKVILQRHVIKWDMVIYNKNLMSGIIRRFFNVIL